MTPGYDTSTPTVRSVQPCDVRANMTYDPGPHPTPVAASPAPPDSDGDEPIVVVKPE